MVYFNTTAYGGGGEYGKISHLYVFTSLKHLMMLLKYNFSELHFYAISQTLLACRAMQLSIF